VRTAVAATERAAKATAGRLLLLREGTPASVYYSASCGGRTQLPSDVWPGAEDPPYLPSKEDKACDGAPAWIAELHESDVQRALRASGFRGDLHDLRIASRNASARRAADLRACRIRTPASPSDGCRLAAREEHGIRSGKKDGSYRFSGHAPAMARPYA
jgi:SpoIID/LytB domain protein